ncbi:cyclase [Patiriisocius marinistellae]|uniref:beta-lactamase n=1 Tax=Patiriisocius marinistellae TaxID=2494560 RepID=A0A5J4FU09_9FLAO|nr:MBL fold metallo-hydrolase [Patiriisocius marinistellae]GEQ85280.1 cyclase [Patiriisocius marinistellae]
MRTLIIICLLFICTTTHSISQEDSAQQSGIILKKVKDDIYMLKGKGGNVAFVAGKKSVLMIDDKFADLTPAILEKVKSVSKKPIQFLINTHHHGDHTGGNENLANEGALIIAQDNVRGRISEVMKTSKTKMREEALPVITFSKDINIHHNNETVMIFHVHNAHTDGDAVVFFSQSNVIHTGDVLFNGKYPYIDLKSGGSVLGYIEGLESITKIADENTKIIPGHGELATKTDVVKTINMLTYLWKQIMFHHGSGKTEAEILAMKDLTKKYDDLNYGDGFITTEKIIKTIYEDVEKTRTKK